MNRASVGRSEKRTTVVCSYCGEMPPHCPQLVSNPALESSKFLSSREICVRNSRTDLVSTGLPQNYRFCFNICVC